MTFDLRACSSRRLSFAALWLAFSVGCSNSATAPSMALSSPTGTGVSVTTADLAFCVQDLNAYRMRLGRSPLTESSALESFAATGAQQDTAANRAHSHFIAINGGGVALAENEVLNWGFASTTVQMIMKSADTLFFAEGPGGGHYENMTNAQYTQAGCGAYIANGNITMTEDFR